MKQHITEYKELLATFVRIKDNKHQQEYTVPAERKETKKDGANASR